MRYVDLVELDFSNSKFREFKKDVMLARGYQVLEFSNKDFYYNMDVREFAKCKLKYDGIELKNKLESRLVYIDIIPRNDPIMHRMSKKHNVNNIIKVKKGTKYYIKREQTWKGQSEKIILEYDIDWKVA